MHSLLTLALVCGAEDYCNYEIHSKNPKGSPDLCRSIFTSHSEVHKEASKLFLFSAKIRYLLQGLSLELLIGDDLLMPGTSSINVRGQRSKLGEGVPISKLES